METQEKTKRMLEAMRSPAYADTEPAVRLRGLTVLLMDESDRKGQSATGSDVLAYRLDRDIEDFYGRQITTDEVLLALKWGLRGEYGEYTGLNADRLFRFVRSYLLSPERAEALKRRQESSLPAGLARPDTDTVGRMNWEAMFSYAIQAWDEFVESGRLPGTSREQYSGVADALRYVQRRNEANTYCWLKSVRLIPVDPGTAASESECLKSAERILRRAGGHAPGRSEVKSLGYAMLLESYFRGLASGRTDFRPLISGIASTPESERRFW